MEICNFTTEISKSFFPSEQDIIQLVAKYNGKYGRREIAKYFNLNSLQKEELKTKLKDLRKADLISKGKGNLYSVHEDQIKLNVIGTVSSLIQDESYIVKLDTGKEVIAFNKKYKKPLIIGERIAMKLSKSKKYRGRHGKVTKRLGTQIENRSILGVIVTENNEKYLRPVSKKNRHLLSILPESIKKASEGDLVQACYISKEELRSHGLDPRRITVRITELLRCNIHSHGKDLGLIALNEHHLPIEFSQEVLDSVLTLPTPSDDNRRDMTDLDFITIDPATARDHDDAVCAYPDTSPDNQEGYVVHVAIADVAHYVRSGSLIDIEARKRGNSIYLPDRMVPMLPEKLATDLCSLKASVIRPAMVVSMRFAVTGRKISHKFHRALICCKGNLSYEEVFRIDQGTTEEHLQPFISCLKSLFSAYKIVSKAREERNPLNIDLPEYEINIDDQGEVSSILNKERLFTHKLIEEFMVLANVCAAETLEKRKHTVIYRSHDMPPSDKTAQLKTTLKELNFSFSAGQVMRPRAFNGVLNKVRDSEFKDLINKLILRCQCQAVYSTKNEGHFGLNLAKYAHFTSPIRRYADLFIHRALISALSFGNDGLTEQDIENAPEIADYISKTERKAMQVEMETKDRYLARFMEKKIGNQFNAIVSGVSTAGLFVRVPEYGAEGLIPMVALSILKKRFFIFEEKKHMLIDRRSGDYYILGQNITVQLKEATPLTGGMRFDLVDESDLIPSPKRRKISGQKPHKKIKKKDKRVKIRTRKSS